MEDDYISGLKFTNYDVNEVINKMDRELTWISVIVPKDYQGYLADEELQRKDNIFEKFGFEELEDIGHSNSCTTKVFVKTITLFEGRKNELYFTI